MATPEVRLEAGEAAGLAGLLSFLGDWLVSDGKTVASSLGRFVDGYGYDLAALRSDLARPRSCSPARTDSGFSRRAGR